MPDDALSEPKRLLNFFDLETVQASRWVPTELGQILTHELDAKLRHALKESQDDPLSDLTGEWAAEDATLRRLLAHENPPLELIERLKRIAKKASTTTDGSLPKEVATVLYVAAIIVGQRAGHQISNLDEPSLRGRAQWASRRRWLDADLRPLFDSFLSA